MIRPIDIRLNAAHPELPLAEAVTFTGSPSTVLIRGVPPNCGRWAITAVSVAATFPDGSTTTRAAVQSANGVWVATLPVTARSGRTANGLRVLADGIDENGVAVTGYILGVADFAVASLGVTPAPEPGETSWQMLYFDAVPGTLRKGDVTKVDGVLKLYNGTAWEPFAAPVTFDDAVTRTSANGVKSSGIWSALWGTASTAFSSLYDWVVAQLAGKASTADATLNISASSWTCSPSTIDVETETGVVTRSVTIVPQYSGTVLIGWAPATDGTPNGATKGDAFSSDLVWESTIDWVGHVKLTATRDVSNGMVLGSQTDKPLASEEEAEALRMGKADRPTTFTTGNLAALDANGNPTDSGVKPSDKLDSTSAAPAFSSSSSKNYSVGSYCTHDGKLYVCMIATSGGTWVANCWATSQLVKMPAIATTDNLVTFGNDTRLKDSGIAKENVALKGDIPYDLGTPIVIDSASSETVEGETVYYGAATLADRTANIVRVTAATALDELRITFPAATSSKVRDFGLRVEIGTGSAALTAPSLVPIAPTGETIKIENADRAIPELADGTATAKGVTLLYFSENAPGVFVVKGEQVEEVA